MTDFLARHRATLDKALDACAHRHSWTAYPESPSSKIHGEEKPAAGRARFEALLGTDYPLQQPGEIGRTGAELSPYTGEPLGISYPKMDVGVLYDAIAQAMPAWRAAPADTRIGICLEILDRCAGQLFENAHATMHTSGQSYIMAFAGSGANALDRGLEALAYAHKAMADVPASAHWERQFGKGGAARLEKHYQLVPRGIGRGYMLRYVPPVERLSRPLRQPRHRQSGGVQTPSQRHPAGGDGDQRLPPGTGGGRL